jgi:hypothetical protein
MGKALNVPLQSPLRRPLEASAAIRQLVVLLVALLPSTALAGQWGTDWGTMIWGLEAATPTATATSTPTATATATGTLIPNGDRCAAPTTCQSGNCVDGFCCDTACDGLDEVCNLAGQEGTCAVLEPAPTASHGTILAALLLLAAVAGIGIRQRRVAE